MVTGYRLCYPDSRFTIQSILLVSLVNTFSQLTINSLTVKIIILLLWPPLYRQHVTGLGGV